MPFILDRISSMPWYCPNAFIFPCLLVGRMESIFENERPIDCLPACHHMGKKGCCMCVFSACLNFCLPLPISPLFACFSICLRWKIMDQFNIEGGCAEILLGCCYPCAVYQQLLFLDKLKEQRQVDSSGLEGPNLQRKLLHM